MHIEYMRKELADLKTSVRDDLAEVKSTVGDVRRDLEALKVARHQADISMEQRMATVESGLRIAMTGGVGGGVGIPALTWLITSLGG